MKEIFLLFLIIVFLLGLYLYSMNFNVNEIENKEKQSQNKKCPDVLIRKGNKIYLYNKNDPENTIEFSNIEEYSKYLEIQNKDLNCPKLYLQQENNTQGKDVYRMVDNTNSLFGTAVPSGTRKITNYDVSPYSQPITNITAEVITNETKPLLQNREQFENPIIVKDANRENPPYNANNHNGFDPQGLYIGKYTNIDEIHYSTEKQPISDNPLDPNWGGVQYTEQSVNSGKYEENYVYKPTYYTPVNGVYSVFNQDIGNTISINSRVVGNTFIESFASFR
jgi:hypothetical protein